MYLYSQQNRDAERKRRHVLEVTKALRVQAHILLKYLVHCVPIVVYLINRIPSRVLTRKSPYERLYRKRPC